jgi:hypothetical protein
MKKWVEKAGLTNSFIYNIRNFQALAFELKAEF